MAAPLPMEEEVTASLLRDFSSASLASTGPKSPRSEERPVVFLCAGCKRPLGDTLSWEASDEDSTCVLLKSVTLNVSVDKVQRLSSQPGECGCLFETLFCSGCKMTLGSIYRCTPRHLDYKKDLFCLNVDTLESYTLGSSEQKVNINEKPLTLENRAVLEKSLERAERLLKALEQRLSVVESNFVSLHNMD